MIRKRKKRPCGICRKWFQEDVRQIGRQQTCGRPDCQKEHHRRLCAKLNKRNKENSKNEYLDKKIEHVKELTKAEVSIEAPDTGSKHSLFQAEEAASYSGQVVLPKAVIVREYGIKAFIIIHYLAVQIISQSRTRASALRKPT